MEENDKKDKDEDMKDVNVNENPQEISTNAINESNEPNVQINLQSGLYNRFEDSKNILDKKKADEQSEILKETISKKRKRNIYDTSEVFQSNKRKKVEKTINQKIFDTLIKKNVTDDENIKFHAKEMGQELNQDQVEFYKELMKTKVVYNKVGLPSNICKSKMHFRHLLITKDKINIINDDKIFWYYMICKNVATGGDINMINFTGAKTKNCLEIKTISVCSKLVKTAEVLKQGYCQDFYPNKCYLSNKTINIKNDQNFKEELGKCEAGVVNIAGVEYNSWISDNLIIIDDEKNINNVIERFKQVKLIEGKSSFKEGIRRRMLKSGKQGVFYNIHDVKIDDFIPSIVSTVETLSSCVIFLDCELNSDVVLKSFNTEAKRIADLKYPKDMVFWDNINSFNELLIVYITCFNVDKDLKNEIIEFNNEYYKYKNIINVWKSLYNLFETIVLNYYDSITTRMSIDQISKLDDKCRKFENLYVNLTKHSSYANIMGLLVRLGEGCRLMTDFLNSNRVPETILSIKRVILFMRTRTLPKDITVEMLIHGVGVQCIECLYDGLFPIIPKVRSRCCYLGGVGKDIVTAQNVNSVVMKITKEFSNVYKEQEKEEKELLKIREEAKKKVEGIFQNTLKFYRGGMYAQQAPNIYEVIKKDYNIMNSLVDDVTTWMYDPVYDDYEKTGKLNFLLNPLFMRWMETLHHIATVLLKYFNQPSLMDTFESITVDGDAAPPGDIANDVSDIVNLKKIPENLINKTRSKINPNVFIYDGNLGQAKVPLNDEGLKKLISELKSYNTMR